MIGIEEQIACVERELKMRARVYQRRVASGQMTINKARQETAEMEAVLQTLKMVARGDLLI